jgi:hypothetical protein
VSKGDFMFNNFDSIEGDTGDEQPKPNYILLDIQQFLKTASQQQLWFIGEFIGVLAKDGDSGNMHDTLKVCIDMHDIHYVRECLDTIERMKESEKIPLSETIEKVLKEDKSNV